MFNVSESLHRLVKEALDSGAAASLEEAEALFRGYAITFTIDADEAKNPACQAALVTGIALARRVFLGGVSVVGAVDVPLKIPFAHLGRTLAEAVHALGGKVRPDIEPGKPVITVGGATQKKLSEFHVRAVFFGWRGGIVPADSVLALIDADVMPLAPMLAAALAVNEAFLYVRQETGAAGRVPVGMSLWQPENRSWLDTQTGDPLLRFLPTNLWLIGLGHLGQAYLWGLGLLPYPKSGGLHLVLQDKDIITPSTESTSVLSEMHMAGQKKTRAMAAWAENHGFETSIYERLFDNSCKRRSDEPAIALCGLDNALGRRALDSAGFDFIVEAGLGRGFRDFRTIRLHTLPGTRSALEIWKNTPNAEDVSSRASYQKLKEEKGLDRCGITLLAGKAVGAPFVGSVAACLVLSEVLRLLHGGQISQLIDLDLGSTEFRTVVPQIRDFSTLNPGFVAI